MAQIVLAQTDSPTAPSAGQTAFSFPATALNQFKWVDADGGTNILDLGGKTLTVSQNLTLAGATGKTLTLTGSLIVPADGTAALLGTANVFTEVNTFDGGTVGSGSGDATTVLVAKTEANASDSGRGPAIAFRNMTGFPLRAGRIAVVSLNHYASNVAMTFSVGGETSSEERMRLNGAGHLLLNTTADSGQLTVKAGSTSTVGLVVDTAASTAERAQSWLYNSVDAARVDVRSDRSIMDLLSRDLGNNVAGPRLGTGRNSNAGAEGPAAGTVLYIKNDDTNGFTWVDGSGNLRIYTSAPTGSSGTPTVADTAGTVVGTQTSTLASKIMLGEDLTPGAALRVILQTPVKHFRYKNDAYNGSEFHGIVADYSPEFAMDDGRVFNPVSAVGYLIQGIKALTERIQQLEAA